MSTRKNVKKFDLNIEDVLDDWKVYHALREIISNAIDEQALTESEDIKILKDKRGRWHIRDYGRGLKSDHFTQNECDEKLENPEKVIGKFGVGLKDALATFERNKIKVLIKSNYHDVRLGRSPKANFNDVVTLHAFISNPSDSKMVGTDFILGGISDKDIARAKNLFLKYSGEVSLEDTRFGSVLRSNSSKSRIYINGLCVAEEDNFLFSYNITSITSKIKKSLNRERTNVGRGAYTDRIKSILLDCKGGVVANLLTDDLSQFEEGCSHDELGWKDISAHACKLLNISGDVIFLTPNELVENQDMVDSVINDGLKIVTIPENVKSGIQGTRDIQGNEIRDLEGFIFETNENFQFEFVPTEELSAKERKIFSKTKDIFNLIGGRPRVIKKILISETMKIESNCSSETVGIWESMEQQIIIKRSTLKSVGVFSGVLLHETAHAISGASDVSRKFESELTRLLGLVVGKTLKF